MVFTGMGYNCQCFYHQKHQDTPSCNPFPAKHLTNSTSPLRKTTPKVICIIAASETSVVLKYHCENLRVPKPLPPAPHGSEVLLEDY